MKKVSRQGYLFGSVALATDRQRGFMDANRIPYTEDTTKTEASRMIAEFLKNDLDCEEAFAA